MGFQEGHGAFQHVSCRVGFDSGKYFITDLALSQRSEEAFHHARRHQPFIGDYQQFFLNLMLEQCAGLTHQAVSALQGRGEIKLERVHGSLRFLIGRETVISGASVR
ncbi:hypothetical protein D3C87_1429930 [compost metagenome]